MGIFSPVIVCIDMVATSRFLYDGVSAPNEVSDTLSFVCNCKLSLQARFCEMKELCDPSSNRMLPSIVVPSLTTGAIAVFKRHMFASWGAPDDEAIDVN